MIPEPPALPGYEVRRVHGFRANKDYVCPGCGNSIPSGEGHAVAWPQDAPDYRRHWHHHCWRLEARRHG